MVVVVPWFSRAEWKEVYEAAFSNDVGQWKYAKDTMLVWQARVDRLPVGVEVTLPLLQAKIAEADPTIDKSLQSVLSATAIQRFVSLIVKLPQTNYYQTKSMYQLAIDIGLPMHLVDLRHEIVHSSRGWDGGETLQLAVHTSYEWIKGYYWDAEWEKLQVKMQVDVPQEEWKRFQKQLQRYVNLFKFKSGNKQPQAVRQAGEKMLNSLMVVYPYNPQECIEAIVSTVLLSPVIEARLKKNRKAGGDEKCGCFFSPDIITGVDVILKSLHVVEESADLLFAALIKKGQSSPIMVKEWICLIAGSVLGEAKLYSRGKCSDHYLHVDEELYVNWKAVVLELLDTESNWAVQTASKLISCQGTHFSDKQKEQLKELLHIVQYNKEGVEQEDDTSPASERLCAVEDVITAAQQVSATNGVKAKKLEALAFAPNADKMDSNSPIGVQGHQSSNDLFFKDLLLH